MLKIKQIPGFLIAAALFGAVSFHAGPADAEDCVAPKPADEMSAEEVDALYDCIRDELRAGYKTGDNEVAAVYTDWQATAIRPAAPGFHSARFLMTFVNPIGFDTYVEYAEEGVEMPVGTLIAKESYKVNKKLNVRRGPLFIMKKVAAGTADEFDNWVYETILPGGKPMKFKQKFCHDCHVGFKDQDNLGYPAEDVRLTQ